MCAHNARIDCFTELVGSSAFGEKLKEQVEERLRFYDEGVAPTKNATAMQARPRLGFSTGFRCACAFYYRRASRPQRTPRPCRRAPVWGSVQGFEVPALLQQEGVAPTKNATAMQARPVTPCTLQGLGARV